MARAAILSPSCSEQFGPRADEEDSGLFAGAGQIGVFRKETVAGMNGIDLPILRQRDQCVDIEIRADRLAGMADEIGLVGLQPVQGEPVLVGIDGDGPNAQLVPRPEDPDGDFTAIGDEKSSDAPH